MKKKWKEWANELCPNVGARDFGSEDQLMTKKQFEDSLYGQTFTMEDAPFEHKDMPVEELLTTMDKLIKEGWVCYVKFDCSRCGSRQTSDTTNAFHTKGYTCEECDETSYPKKYGLLVMKGFKK
jgi:predicted RNA-binding Zn-ribbon protein involved in translation (DUF1610 family)